MNLKGKTALITGGAVRIGRAICKALAGKGCNIVVHFNRSGSSARQLVAELRRTGVSAFCVRGDLSLTGTCARVMKDAWRVAGRIDILVNNAAVFHKDTIKTATAAKFQSELAVNLIAPVTLTQEFCRLFRKAGRKAGGRVINLLDRRIASNEPDCVPYLLSKKMLAEFTGSSALELAPTITVNGVAPGAVLPPPGKGKNYIQDFAGQIPLGRRPAPEDVADAVTFLAESDSITGQIIFVDGGQHLQARAERR